MSGAQGYLYTMQPTGPYGTFECGPRPEVRVLSVLCVVVDMKVGAVGWVSGVWGGCGMG